MQIAGGTYLEVCRDAGRNEDYRMIIGSGLRAAAYLTPVCRDLTLLSAIDETTRAEATAIAEGLGVTVEWTPRTDLVGFSYSTPLSSPSIRGLNATAQPIAVTGENALVFGMLEGKVTADVNRLVYDPQKPTDLGAPDLSELHYEHLAIVANAGETRAMAGLDDVRDAASRLLEQTGADVVVAKCAARGSLVTTSNGQTDVGVWPTETVWPVGSGDVFAAGFAWAWAEQQMDPVQAARVGSHLASVWCGERRWQPRREDFDVPDGEFQPQDGRIYLAAPFFSLSQRWLVELVRGNVIGLGGEVFSPLHDVGRGEDEVAKKDLAGLEGCTAMLALLDDVDAGVLFESGWARRGDMPVVVYTEHQDDERLKMVRGSGALVCTDLSSAVYRSLWASMGYRA